MNELDNPLRGPGAVTTPAAGGGGVIAVEQQRAVAEVQARMMIARANPRRPVECMDLILADCDRPTVAEHAVYQYARGGTDITGPSIKLVEGIARRWGNIASGIKEMSRTQGYSECIAYAWDLETGYYDERQFQVRHWRDTKGGGYPIKDERDIYELIANMGQRRKRAVLQTVIPDDVIEAAVKACEKTLKAKADTSEEGIKRMLEAFTEYRVTRAHIEAVIQRRLDTITPAQMVRLKKIYASLRDGMSEAKDWFDMTLQADAGGGVGVGSGGTDDVPKTATEKAKEAIRAKTKKATTEPDSTDGVQPGRDPAATTEGPTAEALREQLMKAADKDAAMQVLDLARSLPAADYDSLVELLGQRFPD